MSRVRPCSFFVHAVSLLLSCNLSKESAIWQSIPLLLRALRPTSRLQSSPTAHTHAYRTRGEETTGMLWVPVQQGIAGWVTRADVAPFPSVPVLPNPPSGMWCQLMPGH